MKNQIAAFILILGCTISTIVSAEPSEKSAEQSALEQKLVGVWIGQGPCDGKMVFEADGTFHVTDWTVGTIYGTGSWKIEGNQSPPLLVLSPTTTEKRIVDQPKPTRVTLLKLNDEQLNFGYQNPNGSPAGKHRRGTEVDDVKIRLRILDAAVQSYLGSKGKLPADFNTLIDAELITAKSLMDPWGNKFQYDYSGTRNKGEKPDIWTETNDKRVFDNWSEKE